MTGYTLARCPGILALQMAINTIRFGMGASQRVETMVKVITDEENGFSADSVLRYWFGIGRSDDLLGRCRRLQLCKFVEKSRYRNILCGLFGKALLSATHK